MKGPSKSLRNIYPTPKSTKVIPIEFFLATLTFNLKVDSEKIMPDDFRTVNNNLKYNYFNYILVSYVRSNNLLN